MYLLSDFFSNCSITVYKVIWLLDHNEWLSQINTDYSFDQQWNVTFEHFTTQFQIPNSEINISTLKQNGYSKSYRKKRTSQHLSDWSKIRDISVFGIVKVCTYGHIYYIIHNVFFLQKDDITIRFLFSPSSDANWCLTDSQHWEIQKFKSRLGCLLWKGGKIWISKV